MRVRRNWFIVGLINQTHRLKGFHCRRPASDAPRRAYNLKIWHSRLFTSCSFRLRIHLSPQNKISFSLNLWQNARVRWSFFLRLLLEFFSVSGVRLFRNPTFRILRSKNFRSVIKKWNNLLYMGRGMGPYLIRAIIFLALPKFSECYWLQGGTWIQWDRKFHATWWTSCFFLFDEN